MDKQAMENAIDRVNLNSSVGLPADAAFAA